MTREIVINGRFLSRRITGVERHGREIIQLFRDNYRLEKTRLNGITGHAWEQFILPTKLGPNSVLWSPANTGSLFVHNQALTIHDLSPLEHPEWFQTSFAAWYRLLLPILAKRVQMVFTPSEHVKRKITARFSLANVVVAPNGVDTGVFNPNARFDISGLPEKYILFVGSIQPRKNLRALIKAWLEIWHEFNDTWLVIAGERGDVFRDEQFPGSERIRFLNYVPDEYLPGLYAKAILFVLPSLDEGFGIPALEAMACGTPVMVSDGGALPEVIGDAGMIFKLSEPDGLSLRLRECLKDKDLRLFLKGKGMVRVKSFSWQQTADLIRSKLNEL
jgi:glycosyltransferase involved in cell wall biosynthesis